jgi:hypothetical protein
MSLAPPEVVSRGERAAARRAVPRAAARRELRDRPVSPHAVLIGVFAAAVAVGLEATRRRGRLGRGVALADIAALGVATHKLARIVALDRVSVPLRAPFAKNVEPAGAGEVESEPRGRGFRRALGELVTCPYCLAPWLAGAFVLGLLHAPRQTRVLAALLNVVAVSDFLNQRYAHLKDVNR